jgi:hypothetical protein
MYDQVPPPQAPTKPSFNLVVENGPILPPPVPPPPSFNTVPASTQAPRQFTSPNPHGTFRVPDTPSDSDETPHDNATSEQNGSAQPKTTQPKPTQTDGARLNTKPKPAPSLPTEEADDDEAAAWEAAGFTHRAQGPGLEAAMAEYDDDNNNDDQLEDSNEYLPNEYNGAENNDTELTQIQTGDDEVEPDPDFVVRHGVGDDVQYGDVQVEVEEEERGQEFEQGKEKEEAYEAEYEYDEDEDEQWNEKEKGEEDEIDSNYDDVDDEGDL